MWREGKGERERERKERENKVGRIKTDKGP